MSALEKDWYSLSVSALEMSATEKVPTNPPDAAHLPKQENRMYQTTASLYAGGDAQCFFAAAMKRPANHSIGDSWLFFNEGNPEPETGSMAGIADGFNAAAMSSQNGAGDGQTHAGPFPDLRPLFATVEFFENQGKIHRIDPRTAVFDGELQSPLGAVAGEQDAAAGWVKAGSIFQQMTTDAAEQMGIEPGRGLRAFHFDDDTMGAEHLVQLLDGLFQQGSGMLWDTMDLDNIGVNLGHLHCLANQGVEP
jgi:hypothetical protein